MTFSRSFAVALLTTSCLFAGAAQADDPPSKGEQALKYRKSLYQVMAWNFGPLGAMAQGKVPYDAAEFAKRAERVALIAPMLSEGVPGRNQGPAALGAEARDVGQPRGLRREDERPRRPQCNPGDGGEVRRLCEKQGGVLRHGEHVQGVPRQIQETTEQLLFSAGFVPWNDPRPRRS